MKLIKKEMNIFLDKETKVLEKFMSVPQDTRKACVRTQISQVKPILGHIDFSTLIVTVQIALCIYLKCFLSLIEEERTYQFILAVQIKIKVKLRV